MFIIVYSYDAKLQVVDTITNRYDESTSDPSMHVLLVFGLQEKVDRAGYSRFDSMSCDGPCATVRYDESFDPTSAEAQEYLQRMCNQTMTTPYILNGSGTSSSPCPHSPS